MKVYWSLAILISRFNNLFVWLHLNSLKRPENVG